MPLFFRQIISILADWLVPLRVLLMRARAKQKNVCVCMLARSRRDANAVKTLERIRPHCPALHYLFLPDNTWPAFKNWHERPDTVAYHRSMLLLALERGHFARLTGPVHRYFIEGEALRLDVQPQYRADMRERWMLNTDPQLRNRLSGLFSARIVELQFAEWIEATRGMAIVSLEATRPGPDIEARDASGAAVAFELKAIGIPYDDFEIILQSISDGPSGRAISPYAAINFMLFRIYEAAKQLAHCTARERKLP